MYVIFVKYTEIMLNSRAHQLYTYVNKIENGIWWCWNECKKHICLHPLPPLPANFHLKFSFSFQPFKFHFKCVLWIFFVFFRYVFMFCLIALIAIIQCDFIAWTMYFILLVEWGRFGIVSLIWTKIEIKVKKKKFVISM